ncbi:MAG: carboxypeptidase-like regulatory domain-containing protein [Sulfuricaulis sp.]
MIRILRNEKQRVTGMHLEKRYLWMRALALLCFLVAPVAAVHAAIDTATLIKATSSQVSIATAYKAYNRVTKQATYEVAVTNISGSALKGPAYVVLESLSGAGVTVVNAAGMTSGNLPYYVLSSGDLAPGTLRKVSVVLSNPSNVRLNFTPVVYLSPAVTSGALTVVITKPATLITVGSTPLAIEGTVSDSSAVLTVNGAPITLSSGKFQASVALKEGSNTIIARAVKGTEETTATISVSLDMTPPYITVESPLDGAVVTSKFIAVSGLINDIVRGTVSAGQANVTVNGKAATVANRTYLAENVELLTGVNTLTIQGSDQVGNTSTVHSKVTYQIPAAKHIALVSGQSQRARIRAALAQPLKVKLLDEQNNPAVNKPVVFRVIEGDGEVGVGSADQGQAVLIQTDANGMAATPLKVGTRAGNGNNHVTAKAVGFDGQVDFYASADPNPGDKVSINSGNNQRGAANQPLGLPFVVTVTDDGSNVIKGSPIEFKVSQGSGKFQNGATSYTTTTDSDGRASANLTLGSETGLDAQRVTATLVGTALYAGFTASALTSGDPGQTSVSGVVLDNQDHPLPSVTVRVDGTTRQAKTNAQGQFKITEVPVGPVHLIADGSTTSVPGEWPTLPYNLVTVAGADNPLSAPIYMVKLNTANAVWVGKEDKVITVSELPGFALTVKKGSITFPNGDKEGYVSVTPVNASKVPMPPPNGMQPQLIVTIQPTGARFDPPAPLQLPNVDGHAPGAQVEMYSFDHDLEEFVSIGLGTVSADGTVIKTNTGVGVIKAGWHCGSQPSGGGCANNCGECKKCDGNCNCVEDNNKTPTSISNTAHDCKKPICLGGTPFQAFDDSDFDQQCSTGCTKGQPKAKPDGGTCNDGMFCTDPDSCQGGTCKGTPIADKDLGTVEFELKLDPILEGINKFGKLLGVLKTIDVTVTESGNKKLICCEQKQQKDVTVKKAQFGLNGKLETDKIFVPALSFDIRAVRIGVFVKLGVTATANLNGENNFCLDKQCWGGGVGVSGGAEGGVAAEDAAKVISLSGSLASALKLDGNVSCKQIDYGLSHDGLKGKLAVELFDGFVNLNYQLELIAPGPLAQGVIPLAI